jgi:hypothetical protein
MPIVRDASITPFYNLANVRVGQITPGSAPELSGEGTPPLADQYGRYIVLIDGTANIRVVETVRYPVLYEYRNPSSEGTLVLSSEAKAITRVWGSNGANKTLFFHIRLVDSVSGAGIIALTIPIASNFATFSQELYLPFEVGGFVYDTMYYDLSTTPDAINPSTSPDLRLSFNYLGVNPVTAI